MVGLCKFTEILGGYFSALVVKREVFPVWGRQEGIYYVN